MWYRVTADEPASRAVRLLRWCPAAWRERWWVATGGQPCLFHAGLIGVAGVAVLALTLMVARQPARRARLGLGFGGR